MTTQIEIADWCKYETFLRTARKQHKCRGGFIDGTGRTRCDRLIEKGERYIEYLGESAPYESGQRYHAEPCARQHGFLK